ncbi:hypothetical protein Avbf_10655 [Armadillidium vulgare]|nr:hypothetical protein Avbf_10655 [Armadillidium vulgare]
MRCCLPYFASCSVGCANMGFSQDLVTRHIVDCYQGRVESPLTQMIGASLSVVREVDRYGWDPGGLANPHIIRDTFPISWLSILLQADNAVLEGKEKVYGYHMQFIFAKHSTLKDPINISLRRILESGIYDFLFKKYQMTNRTYFESSIYSTDLIAIRLVDIQTAFYALFGGYALSFLAFLAEILMKRKKK